MPADNIPEYSSTEDRAEEAGAAKLWSVYVDEAERYDKSLVASWKSDMEGMLIFAGLFSASLTAFLIESYKTLMQDPGDATVQLLQQILAVSSGNSTLTPLTPERFKPTTSSLVCNALWFISLGLSLSCALVATLLEQWARDFLHRANMRSSPVIRARIYSYLYYGLRRFKMHTVVEVIPSLLHAALLFFFCGLAVFLVPVNKIIAALVAGILFLVVSFYVLLTILPLIHFDSPYRTPLSNAMWGTHQFCLRLWHRLSKSASIHGVPTTIIDNMIEHAITPSNDRHKRDSSALLWTVDALSDNDELQTFVEAIPEAIWGPSKQHRQNVLAMTALRDSTEVNLIFKIVQLRCSCNDGLLSNDAAKRRKTVCIKALWALYTIPTLSPQFLTAPDLLAQVLNPVPQTVNMSHTSHGSLDISLRAVATWSGLVWLRKYLLDLSTGPAASRNFRPVYNYVGQLHLSPVLMNELYRSLDDPTNTQQQFVAASQELCDVVTRHIHLDYVKSTAVTKLAPYQWSITQQIIRPKEWYLQWAPPNPNDPRCWLRIKDPSISDDKILREVEAAINNVGLLSAPGHMFHRAMAELCSIWRPQQARCIPTGLINYMKHYGTTPDTLLPLTSKALVSASKDNKEVWFFHNGMSFINRYLWRCFPATITSDEWTGFTLEDKLVAFWVAAEATFNPSRILLAKEFNAVVQALEACPAPGAAEVLLAVKCIGLCVQGSRWYGGGYGIIEPALILASQPGHWLEAVVILIADFLEECSIPTVIKAQRFIVALHHVLNLNVQHHGPDTKLAVDGAQQARFVRGLLRVVQSFEPAIGHMVVRKVLEGAVFNPPDGMERYHWITEAAAQADMQHVQLLLAEASSVDSSKDKATNEAV